MEKELRRIILENEGDRDDIYSDVKRYIDSLIWHGPDVVPKGNQYVLNQSRERVTFDSDDKEWYSYDIPTRIAHVEKWRYPEPQLIEE